MSGKAQVRVQEGLAGLRTWAQVPPTPPHPKSPSGPPGVEAAAAAGRRPKAGQSLGLRQGCP